MTFTELRATIDARLAIEPRLLGSHHELRGDASVWVREGEGVVIAASGTTGTFVEYLSNGRVAHNRIFATSPLSIDRIVITVAEHLTSYAFHRT